MTDELREKAKAFGEKHREQGTDGWQLMADFAAECVRAERERADNLQQECDDVYERLSWILAACTIDRDAKHEIEGLLK